ncbi:hypothetical protein H5410_057616 [Solanum commersonii]|uniref:Uncharacterized protein n=1 Tax=Solanum commersonii TaxID=4109 RepID=A0A9J5WPH7_SOLCO|nr:hypothetical protein H5410_057616 [Solanum commersonii]
MSTIPFLPYRPPNASRNDLPPVLLPISIPNTPPIVQQCQSRTRYYPSFSQNTKEHGPQLTRERAVCFLSKKWLTFRGMPLGNKHKDVEIWGNIVEKTEKYLFEVKCFTWLAVRIACLTH